MENSVDPSHLYWLHGETAHLLPNVARYEEEHEFIPFESGIYKRRITPGKNPGDPPAIDQHPLLFPNTLRHVFRAKDKMLRHNLQIRVPIDDGHTQVFVVYFEPNDKDRTPAEADVPWSYFPIRDEQGRYRLEHLLEQDGMARETQGAIAARSAGRRGGGDAGRGRCRVRGAPRCRRRRDHRLSQGLARADRSRAPGTRSARRLPPHRS